MKHRKPESFIKQPNYPGGNKALDEFIKQNLRYPEEAMKNKVEGTVSVDIDIDVQGRVTSTKVKHGIGYGCDEEARRLAGLLQFEKKKYRGLRVIFHRNINIHFKLHDASPVQSQEGGNVQVAYQYKEKPKSKGGESYTYNIPNE
jgi:TonB family protein